MSKKGCYKEGTRCKVHNGPIEKGCKISDKGRCVVDNTFDNSVNKSYYDNINILYIVQH